MCSGTYIERTANGAAAIDALERRMTGVIGVVPVGSKESRAYAASDELNAGNWFLPHPQNAPWVNDFLYEASSFPRSKHDDFVDAWTQASGQLTSAVDYSMFNERVDVFMGMSPSYFRKPWEW